MDNTTNDAILTRLIQWGETQPPVRAMLLTSTRAIPGGRLDIFSDYDVILVLVDIHPYHQSREWLDDFGPLLTLYRDPIEIMDGYPTSGFVVQYEGRLKIDFTLWQVEHFKKTVAAPQLPDELDAGYLVLLDKDGLADGIQPPSYQAYIPKPPTETRYHELIECFFLDTCYVAKFLWRDDLIAAKHLLDHYIKQDYMVPVLVWRMEINHGWSVKPGLYGQRLKKWLRPDLWAALESTYCGPGIEENWEALWRTIDLFRKTAIEVGDKLGYAYLHELDRRVVAQLEGVKNLDHDG